jgi:hypothetical protein
LGRCGRRSNALGNLLVWGIDELVAVVNNGLKRIQYRPKPIDAFPRLHRTP